MNSRALYRVGPGFEEPQDHDATTKSRLESTLIQSLMMMEMILRWGEAVFPPQMMRTKAWAAHGEACAPLFLCYGLHCAPPVSRCGRIPIPDQAKRDDIYGKHTDLDEVGFTEEIVPPPFPTNAKFDITSTMIQLLNMKGIFK
ncbi:hypothetical protein HAX54_028636, partial [Datura stramonium]|nr:hypothetical protein [Datura stramonium]